MTRGRHLREEELARLSNGEIPGSDIVEHLRWCTRCRSAAAEYDWLQEEIASTLGVVAEAVSIPRPQWREVSGRLLVGHRRAVVRHQLSGAVGIVAVCLMVIGSSVMGASAAAQSAQAPEIVTAPPPIVVAISENPLPTAVTPTRDSSDADAVLSPVPALAPLPTP